MNEINYLEQIKDIINRSNKGSVFVASDFAHVASNEIVRKNLSLLSKRKFIKRIKHGLYLLPEYSSLTGEQLPFDATNAAAAIARNFGWNIIPYGQTALNILGLSNQVPIAYEYLSDGPYRSYDINGYHINFLHRANKDISSLPYKTALIIAALKALGQNYMTDDVINTLKLKLSKDEKHQMLDETKYITKWIREILEKIVRE